jgi:hypothetical protein
MGTILLVAGLVTAIAIAWIITTLLGIASAKYVLSVAVLTPLRASLGLAPWTGWAYAVAVLYHAIDLAWPAALVGAALVLFTDRKPWPAAVAWVAAVVAYATIHPLAPTGGQACFHAFADMAGAISATVLAGAWYRRPERATSAQLTFSAIVVVELLTVPADLHVGPFQGWATPQALWGATFALLTVAYGYNLWRRMGTCERRQASAAQGMLHVSLFAESAVQTAERAERLALEARNLAETRHV